MPGICTVGCKIPNGLILNLYKLVDTTEPSPSGGREVKAGRQVGEPVKLNGCSQPLTGEPRPWLIIGGYGLTSNVDHDFMKQWLKDNAELDMVRNKLIIVHEKREHIEKQAKEMKLNRSNMEPLNTQARNTDKSYKDPRMPRQIKAEEEPMDSDD